MKILAFSGSNSASSINQQLIQYVSSQIHNHSVTVASLRDYELPLFGVDLEKDITQPKNSLAFRTLMDEHDAFIISCPEHNGSMPTVFKNFIDWQSRNPLQQENFKLFCNKPLLLLATSPGARGGLTNLENLLKLMPYWGAQVRGHFSLPSFLDNFSDGEVTGHYQKELQQLVLEFTQSLD
ncbi:NADPH-dependent FMN reductase [Kangiella sp. TOML190]|uniref:NADPH-dependent FMN reductase n=1 Tax=Kangiella sp. TOML190 TaxID=2931351 RepID=UPI00203F7070|nr:NADPH-dependent FMN reductase [Kangiella sp. TOML190]